jgi:hypothetical protein
MEERESINIYCSINNCTIDTYDVIGLWWNHRPFIDSTVDLMYPLLSTTSKCKERIHFALLDGNSSQDDPLFGGLLDNARHYNRSISETGIEGQLAYHKYLTNENTYLNNLLKTPSTPNCRRALWSLGRMSHSWEDFFIHAIRKDGKGGKENSDYPGWTAWTALPPITGNPSNRDNFYPSSYSSVGGGEHPSGLNNEPILANSPEYSARYNAALAYTQANLGPLLIRWLNGCRCSCERSGDISWYTTELPFR